MKAVDRGRISKEMEDYSYPNCSVSDLRRFLISKGITVGTFKKASLVKLRLDGNIVFQEDVLDLRERLGINDVQMPDVMVPFWTMKVTGLGRIIFTLPNPALLSKWPLQSLRGAFPAKQTTARSCRRCLR